MTKEQEAALDNLAQASGASWIGRRRLVETPTVIVQLMDEISQPGHVPTKASTASTKEKKLEKRLKYARTAGALTREQEAAFDKKKGKTEELVQQVRELGDYPKVRNAACSCSERQLALKLGRALNAEQLSPEQEAGLQALRHASPKQEEELMQQVSARRAEDSARRAEELIQQVRDLGH